MNEIDLLRGLRSGLPGPRPEKRAAARAALIAQVTSPQQRARVTRRLPWRTRRARIAVAAVAFAALAVVVSLTDLGKGDTEPAAAQILHQVADVAAQQPELRPGPGQYLYTRSRNAYLSATGYNPRCRVHPCDRERPWEVTEEWSVLVPSEHESWVSFDGSRRGRVRTVTGEPRFVSAGQRAGWVAAGKPQLPRGGQVDDTTLSGSVLLNGEDLPTDPVALRRSIEAREIRGVEGPPGEAETFTLIGDMLRGTYLPSAVRAAIYEATAELPGVTLLGEVKDPIGRPGTAVAYTDRRRGIRHELILDPETSVLLGERDSLVRSGAYGFKAPRGTPIGYAAYLESKVVDAVGQRAPKGAGAPDRSVGCYEEASVHGSAAIVHGTDPVATCAKLWREGVLGLRLRRLERKGQIDMRPWRGSPPLVACVREGVAGTHVFPGFDSAICGRLGLQPAE